MPKYRVSVTDKKGHHLGFKHVTAPSADYVKNHKGEYVNTKTRGVGAVHPAYKKRKPSSGGGYGDSWLRSITG